MHTEVVSDNPDYTPRAPKMNLCYYVSPGLTHGSRLGQQLQAAAAQFDPHQPHESEHLFMDGTSAFEHRAIALTPMNAGSADVKGGPTVEGDASQRTRASEGHNEGLGRSPDW